MAQFKRKKVNSKATKGQAKDSIFKSKKFWIIFSSIVAGLIVIGVTIGLIVYFVTKTDENEIQDYFGGEATNLTYEYEGKNVEFTKMSYDGVLMHHNVVDGGENTFIPNIFVFAANLKTFYADKAIDDGKDKDEEGVTFLYDETGANNKSILIENALPTSDDDGKQLNDLFDFTKGTDDRETRLGPERACAQGWVSVDAMKHAIAITTVLACIVGLPLVPYGGMEMILVGFFCVLFCFLYTTHLSYMGLGDLLVLVFFGVVPVTVTYYLQMHNITAEVVVASIACGVVIDALLLVNNFRDRDTDRVAGKNTLVVHIGAEATLGVYLGVGIGATLLGLLFWMNGHLLAFAFPFVYLVLHFFTYLKMKKIWQGKALNECLGETARNIFVYGLTVALGVLLS